MDVSLVANTISGMSSNLVGTAMTAAFATGMQHWPNTTWPLQNRVARYAARNTEEKCNLDFKQVVARRKQISCYITEILNTNHPTIGRTQACNLLDHEDALTRMLQADRNLVSSHVFGMLQLHVARFLKLEDSNREFMFICNIVSEAIQRSRGHDFIRYYANYKKLTDVIEKMIETLPPTISSAVNNPLDAILYIAMNDFYVQDLINNMRMVKKVAITEHTSYRLATFDVAKYHQYLQHEQQQVHNRNLFEKPRTNALEISVFLDVLINDTMIHKTFTVHEILRSATKNQSSNSPDISSKFLLNTLSQSIVKIQRDSNNDVKWGVLQVLAVVGSTALAPAIPLQIIAALGTTMAGFASISSENVLVKYGKTITMGNFLFTSSEHVLTKCARTIITEMIFEISPQILSYVIWFVEAAYLIKKFKARFVDFQGVSYNQVASLKRLQKNRALLDVQLQEYLRKSQDQKYRTSARRDAKEMYDRIKACIDTIEAEKTALKESNYAIVRIIKRTFIFLKDFSAFLTDAVFHISRYNSCDITMLVMIYKKTYHGIMDFQRSVDADWNIVNESMLFVLGGTTPPDMEKAIDMLFLPETLFLEAVNYMRHQTVVLSQFAYTCLPEASISTPEIFQQALSYIIPEADYTSKYLFSLFILYKYSSPTVKMILPPIYRFYDKFASKKSALIMTVNFICTFGQEYGWKSKDVNAEIPDDIEVQLLREIQYWEAHKGENPSAKYAMIFASNDDTSSSPENSDTSDSE
jgi:hypothetical protein